MIDRNLGLSMKKNHLFMRREGTLEKPGPSNKAAAAPGEEELLVALTEPVGEKSLLILERRKAERADIQTSPLEDYLWKITTLGL